MSPEEREQLLRMKTLKVREDIPDDQSFIEQAVIVGEYELDHLPMEYMENLLKTIAKYPEHSVLLMDLIELLKENEIIDY